MHYLIQEKEFDILYFLINYSEIRNFNNNYAEILTTIQKQDLQSKIKNLLHSWSNIVWKVTVTLDVNIITTKNQIIHNYHKTNDWLMLTKHFTDLKITDIIPNSNIKYLNK